MNTAIVGALRAGPGTPSRQDLGATWKYVHYFMGSSLNPNCRPGVQSRRGGSGAYGITTGPPAPVDATMIRTDQDRSSAGWCPAVLYRSEKH